MYRLIILSPIYISYNNVYLIVRIYIIKFRISIYIEKVVLMFTICSADISTVLDRIIYIYKPSYLRFAQAA
jgi:hypothetical protein